MSRAIIIAIAFMYLSLITFFATAMGIDANADFLTGINYSGQASISFLDYFDTFFNMLFFNADLPILVNLFLIYPPIIVIVWQIAEVIRGV
jgi:predicted neutral ceramidase superfamily lipid hydrolase